MSKKIDFNEIWQLHARKFHPPALAAIAYNVTENTVRNWQAGTSEPRARHLLKALREDADLRRALLG